jgi:hypothetical protein
MVYTPDDWILEKRSPIHCNKEENRLARYLAFPRNNSQKKEVMWGLFASPIHRSNVV